MYAHVRHFQNIMVQLLQFPYTNFKFLKVDVSLFECPFSQSLPFVFVADGEEEVDVVSVEPPNRIHPCSPQRSATSTVSASDEVGGSSVSTRAIDQAVLVPRSPSLAAPAVRPPPAKRARRERGPLGRLNSSIDLDNDDESKRATHNVLERRRREDLKLMYTNLRRCLPDLVSNERAAKVKILEHAYTHIGHLKNDESRLMREEADEERRNVKLHDLLAAVRARAARA